MRQAIVTASTSPMRSWPRRRAEDGRSRADHGANRRARARGRASVVARSGRARTCAERDEANRRVKGYTNSEHQCKHATASAHLHDIQGRLTNEELSHDGGGRRYRRGLRPAEPRGRSEPDRERRQEPERLADLPRQLQELAL